jgi:hypothetical protein
MAKMRYDERRPMTTAKNDADARRALSRLYDSSSLTPAGQLRQEGPMIAGLATPRGRAIARRYALVLVLGLVAVAGVTALIYFVSR